MVPEKNYLSATRFAHSIDCGMHGWYLSTPSQAKSSIPLSAFERGSFFHSEIEKFYYTEEPVSTVIPQEIYLKLPPKSQVIPIKEEVRYVDLDDGSKLKCVGFPDVPTKELVVELKSGDHKLWHIWQLAYYIWLMDLRKGSLVYFDSDLVIELTDQDPTYKVTPELIRAVWGRVLAQEAVRCRECSGCPLKKECSLWKGTVSDEMIDLVSQKEELDRLISEKKSLDQLLIKPLQERINILTESQKALRARVIEGNPVNNYYMGDHRIRIQTTSRVRLPSDFVPPAYSLRPDLYKEPEVMTKKLNEEFGIKGEEKVLVIESLEPEIHTSSEASR